MTLSPAARKAFMDAYWNTQKALWDDYYSQPPFIRSYRPERYGSEWWKRTSRISACMWWLLDWDGRFALKQYDHKAANAVKWSQEEVDEYMEWGNHKRDAINMINARGGSYD